VEAALVLALAWWQGRDSSKGQGSTGASSTAGIIANAILGHDRLVLFNCPCTISGCAANKDGRGVITFILYGKRMACEYGSSVCAGTSVICIVETSGHYSGASNAIIEGRNCCTRIVIRASSGASTFLALGR
jgi:hypothetical protein